MYCAYKCIYFLGLSLFLISNITCVQSGFSGRLDHYKGGGSYIGVRPSFSPDGKTIVYSTPVTGNGDIYSISTDGSNPTNLSRNNSYDGDPTWSSDGKIIAFIRETKGKYSHIWRMDSNGKNQKQLTFGKWYDETPSFSPDGTQIVFCRRDTVKGANTAELYTVSLKEKKLKRLTSNNEADWEPFFSKDGKMIVYSIFSSKIATRNSDGTNKIIISDGTTPVYSPISYEILFIHDGDKASESEIYRFNPKNQKISRITHLNKFVSHANYSPDGKRLVLVEGTVYDKEIFIGIYDLKTQIYKRIYNILKK